MPAPLFLLILFTMVLAAYVGIAFAAWFKMRGTRVIVCPETQQPAAVEVDAAHAAVSAILERPDLRLKSCSRWPEREQCKQTCVQQVAIAPHDTFASSLLKHFFDGKACALCHRAISPVHIGAKKPGVLNPISRDVLAWEEIRAQDLPALFETHVPICSNCQIVKTFCRKHPDQKEVGPTRIEKEKPHDRSRKGAGRPVEALPRCGCRSARERCQRDRRLAR
jgi:hypothetical protein